MENKYLLLRQYFESQGYTQDSLAKELGVDKAHVNKLLNGKKPFGKRTAKIWADLFGLSYSWLLTGEGSMLNITTPSAPTVGSVSLPLIPVDAMAGALTGTDCSVSSYECETYIVPIFHGAQFLIRVQGDSMTPVYCSGDIVACKRIPLTNLWFQWGKTYVIDTCQGALIKRIEPSERSGYISIHSENPHYKPFDLAVEEINGIAIVLGVIRAE